MTWCNYTGPTRCNYTARWCGSTTSFIIAPYFLEQTGASSPVTATVTGQRYASLLRNHVIPDLQQHGCVNQIIFMQDGAPPHIGHLVKQLLRRHFENARIISCHFPTTWSSRSPYLNLCDIWLWGYLKEDVFSTPTALLSESKASISHMYSHAH